MTRALLTLAALASTAAFAQSPVPGAPRSGPPNPAGSRESASDADDTNLGEVKSISQVLHDYPKLTANLQTLLPSSLTPQEACSGFKTLEQCIITIHAAQNLKLGFVDLKAKTTGKGATSLQKAIEKMATGINAKDEMKKAKKQASEDLKGVSLFG